MFTFIHAADIHLDSPLRGLTRYESAPTESIRNACRRAFENLVDLAIEEEVAIHGRSFGTQHVAGEGCQ